MLAVYGPHSWFWHKAKKQFSFWPNLVFFYNKNKILTILFIVINEKITRNWRVFSVVGAHNQQVFCMFKWGKTTKGACSSPISMVFRDKKFYITDGQVSVCPCHVFFQTLGEMATLPKVYLPKRQAEHKMTKKDLVDFLGASGLSGSVSFPSFL